MPFGDIGRDAFGNIPVFRDKPNGQGVSPDRRLATTGDAEASPASLRGMHQRAIIALGKQDTLISGLSPNQDLEILGASSDHVVLDCKSALKVGVEVNFNLDYGSLLTAMTSPFIKKQFIQ